MPTATPPAIDRFAIWLAMAGGIGRIKKAPGTFGSLPGLVLGAFFNTITAPLLAGAGWLLWLVANVALLTVATAIAWWSIARTEAVLGIHDDQRIVIDEVVGQALTLLFLPLNWAWYLAGFIGFRLFDITKPGFIGRIDREAPGAVGTLFDDVAAGLVAGLILGAAVYLLPAAVVS